MIAETDRLIISEFTIEDAPSFLELVNSPNWLKFIGDRKTYTLEDALVRLKDTYIKSYSSNGFGFYKLQLKEENNKFIGSCGLIKRDTLDDVDIGFAFLPEYEGKGFGYESSLKIMTLAKEVFGLKRIVAITDKKNIKSIGLIEKLGFVKEKTVMPFEDGKEVLLFAKKI